MSSRPTVGLRAGCSPRPQSWSPRTCRPPWHGQGADPYQLVFPELGGSVPGLLGLELRNVELTPFPPHPAGSGARAWWGWGPHVGATASTAWQATGFRGLAASSRPGRREGRGAGRGEGLGGALPRGEAGFRRTETPVPLVAPEKRLQRHLWGLGVSGVFTFGRAGGRAGAWRSGQHRALGQTC